MSCFLEQVLNVGHLVECRNQDRFQANVRFHWLDRVLNLEKGLGFTLKQSRLQSQNMLSIQGRIWIQIRC